VDEIVELFRYRELVLGWTILALMVFGLLFVVSAPYGRHARKGWGPAISPRLGWIVMEAPAAATFGLFFLTRKGAVSILSLSFLFMWEAHYLHRAIVYPLRMRPSKKRMPVLVAAMAFLFNAVNGSINGYDLFAQARTHSFDWHQMPRFLLGVGLFFVGWMINRWADETLRTLRGVNDTGYRIPQDGLFRWVSCPNYLGEIVQWIGWAAATWSLAGLSFAIWTIANLAPRARAHHRWYREVFPSYPPERRALVPGIW
jgi:protein-S-isoprenylcysteine O-methyltransferase Ste14